MDTCKTKVFAVQRFLIPVKSFLKRHLEPTLLICLVAFGLTYYAKYVLYTFILRSAEAQSRLLKIGRLDL